MIIAMKRRLFLVFCVFIGPAFGAVDTNAMLTPAQYSMMEPYLKPAMRERLRPQDAQHMRGARPSFVREASSASVMPLSNFAGRAGTGTAVPKRRVVARSAARARAAVAAPVVASATNPATTSARAAATQATASGGQRRVVARAGLRADGSSAQQRNAAATPSVKAPYAGDMTPEQCLAAYSQCMDGYCHRPTVRYDRCYCSAKLQQLDGEYRPAIDELIRRIMILKNGGEIPNGMTQEEINEYWKQTFGGSTAMADLDDALNISWAGMESSVRGQNAFIAGDNYCKQNLLGCAYMADNLKAMYRTTIGQDCKRYETFLQKMKYAAEQVVGQF